MDSHKEVKKSKVVYDGSTDVCNFLAKVELEASLKDYADEKKANFLASRLIGQAFEVYMRLSDDNKKSFDEIKKELKKEFERGQLNREEALHILSTRVHRPNESPDTYAHKLTELVKLAYPTFADNVRGTIAKDYFMKGIHSDMQVALKSRASFSTDDISTLASETVRLALAGVKSNSSCTNVSETCSNVNESALQGGAMAAQSGAISTQSSATGYQGGAIADNMINAIADVVVSRLQDASLTSHGQRSDGGPTGVNYATSNQRGRGSGGRGGNSSGRQNSRGRGGNIKACRACQKTDHLIKNCPNKFCQACGQRGHNQYDQTCPNYS